MTDTDSQVSTDPQAGCWGAAWEAESACKDAFSRSAFVQQTARWSFPSVGNMLQVKLVKKYRAAALIQQPGRYNFLQWLHMAAFAAQKCGTLNVPHGYSARRDKLRQQAPSISQLSVPLTGALLSAGMWRGNSTQESVVAEQVRLLELPRARSCCSTFSFIHSFIHSFIFRSLGQQWPFDQ